MHLSLDDNQSGLARRALRRPSRPKGAAISPLTIGHGIALVLALVLWLISLQQVDLRAMTDLGLITVLPITYYSAVGVIILSACILFRHAESHEVLLLLHVVLLIAVLHATPTMLYGSLRYSWAWKHIGIVDYIHRFGRVDPTIQDMTAYHNWPGFFTLSAFLDQAAGLRSPLSYARWASVYFNVLNLGILLLIFRSLTSDARLIWSGILIYFIGNWVGQDYYAPQGYVFTLHLAVLGICLRWFRVTTQADITRVRRWLRFDWLARIYQWIVQHAAPADVREPSTSPFGRIALMLITIAFSLVIVTSHQLTPIMTLVSLATLVVFRQCRAVFLPLLVGTLTAAWIFFFAEHYAGIVIESTFEGIIDPAAGVRLIDLGLSSPGQRTIAIVGRVLTACIWGLGALGTLRKVQLGAWDSAPILLAFVPFLVLATNNYGGEMIFRVYLFSLPFMALLGASVFYPTHAYGRSWIATLLIILLCAALVAGFFFPYYGKESQFYFSPEEVDAAAFLADRVPKGTLLIEGTRNYPSRYRNYEFSTYVAISREPRETQERIMADPVGVLERWMSNTGYVAAYLIITRSQKAEVAMSGPMPARALDRIEEALRQSPKFEVVFQNRDAVIFALKRRPTSPLTTPF